MFLISPDLKVPSEKGFDVSLQDGRFAKMWLC